MVDRLRSTLGHIAGDLCSDLRGAHVDDYVLSPLPHVVGQLAQLGLRDVMEVHAGEERVRFSRLVFLLCASAGTEGMHEGGGERRTGRK